MRITYARAFLLGAVFTLGMAALVHPQSNSQDFPTAITSNEISGTINARDLGDSRLTTYYYALGAEQGDLFINLVTRNFTGDIDVFTASGLRPVTKIVVYADYGEAETGRAVYLRKPERLLLRVQGRTPNDDPATFRLKFAGSFAALRVDDVPNAPEMPKVAGVERGGIRVTSAGTIIPTRRPEPEVTVAKSDAKTEDQPENKPQRTTEQQDKPVDAEIAERKPEVVVSDPIKATEKPKTTTAGRTASAASRQSKRMGPPRKDAEKPDDKTVAEKAEPNAKTEKAPPKVAVVEKQKRDRSPGFRTLTDKDDLPKTSVEAKRDPLESINLVIRFKDGSSLEKKMNEVFKFSVDKGVLTVILKDGSISRYSIVDVARLTIE
ncbi:MAG: hypothetical protein IT173_12440 [Acidobacteria bacterium]|nr:hypothetical protein [Acidobacteriota bacterium]